MYYTYDITELMVRIMCDVIPCLICTHHSTSSHMAPRKCFKCSLFSFPTETSTREKCIMVVFPLNKGELFPQQADFIWVQNVRYISEVSISELKTPNFLKLLIYCSLAHHAAGPPLRRHLTTRGCKQGAVFLRIYRVFA